MDENKRDLRTRASVPSRQGHFLCSLCIDPSLLFPYHKRETAVFAGHFLCGCFTSLKIYIFLKWTSFAHQFIRDCELWSKDITIWRQKLLKTHWVDVNHGNRSFRPGYFSPYFRVISAFQMYYYSSFYKPYIKTKNRRLSNQGDMTVKLYHRTSPFSLPNSQRWIMWHSSYSKNRNQIYNWHYYKSTTIGSKGDRVKCKVFHPFKRYDL